MEKKGKKRFGFLTQFLIKTGLIAAISFVCFTCILQIHRQTGNTMSPFVRDGDLCVFYTLDKVYLNDVVLYHSNDGKLRVGRVTAVEGQTIEFLEEGGYTVDGYEPSEEIPYETYGIEDDDSPMAVQLGQNEVFIMNDFRSITNDSRENGPIKREDVEGKLLFMLRRRNF